MVTVGKREPAGLWDFFPSQQYGGIPTVDTKLVVFV